MLTNCTTNNLINNKPDLILKNNFTNKGFTIIYNTNLYNIFKLKSDNVDATLTRPKYIAIGVVDAYSFNEGLYILKIMYM